MSNYNRVILMGRLTRDPQLSYLPSQTAVCEIGLAVNDVWRDKEGEKREEVCFIDCRAYGKQAEALGKYMEKGRQILVEGKLQLDSWEDSGGNKRSKHRVKLTGFQFMGQEDRQSQDKPGGPPKSVPAYDPLEDHRGSGDIPF